VTALSFRDMIRGKVDVKRLHWEGEMRTREWWLMQAERAIVQLPQPLLVRIQQSFEHRARNDAL
jgi:hypothetical protein